MVPVGVADLGEGLGFVDAEIVDEDVNGGNRGDQRRGALGGRRVGKDGADRARCGQCGRGLVEFRLVAAGDDDLDARLGEALGDREADAGGRSGDEGGLAFELQVHDVSPGIKAC